MEYIRLGDIATYINGYAFKPTDWDTKGLPIIRIQNLTSYNKEYNYCRKEVDDKYKISNGDILISWSASIGVYEWKGEDAVLNQHIFKVKFDKININKHYFKYAVDKYLEKAMQFMHGSTMKHITKKYFDDILIPVPSMELQERIVQVLDKAQILIDKREEQIELLDELVKSKFIEMFGDPVTNPKGWNVSKLGDICTISRGASPRPIDKFLGGPIPWIKIGDATKGDDIYIYKTKEGIIEEGIKKSRLIKKGGLIFANCGVSLGFARILKIDGCIHDGWLAFEDFEASLDKIFFLKSLNYCTEYFRRTAPDGTQPNLNTSIMREYVQILPPMELQQEFSKFIEQVDKLKFEMEKSLKELEDNFNSIMQKAFKGDLF